MPRPKYKRVVLKISGEALQGDKGYGIDLKALESISREIKSLYTLGVQIAIVIGGGNIFRGLQGASNGMDRVQGDNMGMLATVINSLALQGALESVGIKSKALTGYEAGIITDSNFGRARPYP